MADGRTDSGIIKDSFSLGIIKVSHQMTVECIPLDNGLNNTIWI